MLVGVVDIPHEMYSHISSKEDFIEYARTLIPDEFKHYMPLVYNQAYYNALVLRKSSEVDWDEKKELLNEVLEEVIPSGFTNNIFRVEDVWKLATKTNIDRWLKYEINRCEKNY